MLKLLVIQYLEEKDEKNKKSKEPNHPRGMSMTPAMIFRDMHEQIHDANSSTSSCAICMVSCNIFNSHLILFFDFHKHQWTYNVIFAGEHC